MRYSMAVLRTKDARKLGEKDIDKKLNELRLELTKERANIAIGASATSPGRIREIRRAVARILTVKNERQKERAAGSKTSGPKASGVKKLLKGKRSKVKSK
jgi:large subunit ribosomal protein L29